MTKNDVRLWLEYNLRLNKQLVFDSTPGSISHDLNSGRVLEIEWLLRELGDGSYWEDIKIQKSRENRK